MTEKTPSPETIAAMRRYVTGRASAKRQLLFDEYGSPMKKAPGGGLEKYPREYWTPVLRIGKETKGVIGPNPDGTSGAPIGYINRKDAIASAERFIDQCRAILAEHDA